MDTLPICNNYQLEYEFCQGEFLNLGRAVRQVGGICWILTMDWFEGKLRDKPFVASYQSVLEKGRQLENIANNGVHNWARAYANYKPNLRLGASRDQLQFNNANCRTFAGLPGNGEGVVVHLGDGLEMPPRTPQHLLGIVKLDGTYHMFDPNFGAFTADSKDNCGIWIGNICRHLRLNGSRYTDWMECMSSVRFS